MKKGNRPLPVLYTLAGDCILTKLQRELRIIMVCIVETYYKTKYIIVICQSAEYKQGKDSQSFILHSDHKVKSYDIYAVIAG